jgi:hypothetical protein
MVENSQHLTHSYADQRQRCAQIHRLAATSGGAPDIEVPLPVTVDGYDMWEIQALLAMRTDKKSRCKQALVLW